jgi:glycosyltransferase involved in cell wall biosynthesis
MNRTPTVDVVIATNRLLPYLEEAVRSVREQTYRNWRLILVDDGSDVPAELERVAGPDAVVIHRPNGGPPAARNTGIAAGRGELVAFLDDDDVWPSDRLERLVRALELRPDAVASFGDGRYVDQDGRPFGAWTTEAASPAAFLSGATPIPRIVALVARRTALEAVGGFDESFPLADDDELILRLLRTGPMAGIGSHVVDYRRHGRNVTLADWRERYRASLRAILTNIAAAAAQDDAVNVRLLRLNLRRYRSMMAAATPGRAADHVRARRWRSAVVELLDGVRISPAGFARGTTEKVTSRLRSRGT